MYHSEISAKLNEITLKKNIPVHATIELTYRCPLRCVHCYIPIGYRVEGRGYSNNKEQEKELTTEEWKKILKELAQAGCLYLVFTGGEPFLREDLIELCRYATELNFDIRIFTTGIISEVRVGQGFSLARQEASLQAFQNTNVSKFEISFYGRKEIHNKITQNSDSFDMTLDFAKKLKSAGVRVKLKTTLMKENFSEMNYIKKLSEENGFEYSFDPIIAPKNDGDKSNLKHRLSLPQLRKVFSQEIDASSSTPSSFIPYPSSFIPHLSSFFCGAGKNLVGINPYGDVFPCIQIPVSCGNLKKNSFAEIWQNSGGLKTWRNMSLADVRICSTCHVSNKCNRCPGLALLEDGDLFGPSNLACQLIHC